MNDLEKGYLRGIEISEQDNNDFKQLKDANEKEPFVDFVDFKDYVNSRGLLLENNLEIYDRDLLIEKSGLLITAKTLEAKKLEKLL